MPNIKITLKTNACPDCQSSFYDGQKIIYISGEDKCYCHTCGCEHLHVVNEKGHGLLHYNFYIVEGNQGFLEFDRGSIKELESGIYGIKKRGCAGLMFCGDSRDFDAPMDKLLDNKEIWLLEKYAERFLLCLQPGSFMEPWEFLDSKADYNFICGFFGIPVWETPWKIYWVLDKEGRVMGISNGPQLDFSLPIADERFRIGGKIPLKELKEQYDGFALNLSVKKALKKISPKTMLEYCEERIQGQGIWLKRAVYQVYRYMESVAQCRIFCAENWILTAPSGSGKTEFYRTIRDFFELHQIPIPVLCIDLSQITEAGYKGENVATIPRRILAKNAKAKGIAICFLDEADKKCIPSYGSGGIDNNAAVQANLLTLIEGSELKLEVDDTDEEFNSGLTMFVLMGAFQSIRQQKMQEQRKKPLGFGSEYSAVDFRDGTDQVPDSFFEDLSLQDMIDFGMSEELAGRMVQVVNFHKLSDEAMLELIRHKTKEIAKDMGITIGMTEDAAKDFLNISFGSLGVRRPMNMIRELVQNAVAEVFFEGKFDTGCDRVMIDSTDAVHIERSVPASEDAFCGGKGKYGDGGRAGVAERKGGNSAGTMGYAAS